MELIYVHVNNLWSIYPCHVSHESCLRLLGEVMDTLQIMSVKVTSIEGSLPGHLKCLDKDLSALVVVFRDGACPQSVYPSRLSTLEIKFDHIYHSVEATVFIRIIEIRWRWFSVWWIAVDANGVITLSRHMVSVKLERNVKVSVMEFPINKGYAAETSEVVLKPHRAGRYCGIYCSGVC
ncbi:hypothetical protein ZWY2020_034811 [Hordeum vulgare]|nr:hypothetical protein ZWY2020_034811 [Hordeum vulgare]